MSERPQWMPSAARLNRDFYENVHRYSASVRADVLCQETGLRAQVAALEELIAGHEGSAMVDRAKAMIEEIRKEIG